MACEGLFGSVLLQRPSIERCRHSFLFPISQLLGVSKCVFDISAGYPRYTWWIYVCMTVLIVK